MIRSMTGYGRVQQEESEFTLVLSVKSINHRFLDLQIRLSAGLETLEPVVRDVSAAYIIWINAPKSMPED